MTINNTMSHSLTSGKLSNCSNRNCVRYSIFALVKGKERGTERWKKKKGDKQRKQKVRKQPRKDEERRRLKQGGRGRSEKYNQSTLQRRISGKVTGCDHVSGRKPYLDKEAEKELADTLKTLAQRGFPLTKHDVQQAAFDFATVNKIPVFSKKAGRAGYYWFKKFLKRNPELGMRKPEVLSVARAAGLNKEVVSQWFNHYEELLIQLGIWGTPSHIWNCDESELQDQFSSTKVVGQVGQPFVEVCAGERGETTTCLAAFNAEGTYCREMIIFKGKRLRHEWLQGCPENTRVRCSDNGWITSDLFLEWAQMFVDYLPKDDPKPHLLLLDGHSSHVYNTEFIKLMKSKNVHVMCYPSHTTHELQPADKSLFKSLKHHWDQEGRKWTRMMAGKRLPKTQFFALFQRT
ncbi:uncharacterized protein V6R79_002528 [Siganus canaliculatus]